MIILWIVLVSCTCTIQGHSWVDYERVIKNVANSPEAESISPQCLQDLGSYAAGLILGSSWALRMLDSSAKIPSGILTGNIVEMGNYDECLAIDEMVKDRNIRGKFCKAQINLAIQAVFQPLHIVGNQLNNNSQLTGATKSSVPIEPSLYICVPTSCEAADLQRMFIFNFDEEQCFSAQSGPELDTLAIFAIVCFSVVGLITIASTTYDVYMTFAKKEVLWSAAISFSLYTNAKKLFHVGHSQQLQSLNGIKSISMLWVVLGHVYMTYLFVPLDNYLDAIHWISAIHSQLIAQATLAVDTFLLIGGFLTVYTFQTAVDKGIKFRPLIYYLHRFLRLTPSLAAILLAHVALFNYLGSGPVWKNTNTFLVQGCKNYWWSTLLYIQNYVNPNGICIPQSWYLSLDMQLFLMSPIILLSLRKWPTYTNLTLIFLCLGSTVASFAVGWHFNLQGSLGGQFSGDSFENYMKYYYMPTHTRMVPYLIGIMLGYEVHLLKNSRRVVDIDKVIVVMGWMICLALMFTCIFAGHNLTNKDYDRLEHSIFLALIRPVWAGAVGWVIFACGMGLGGPIDTFLSLPVFQVLSRLSYSIYIIHYSFLFMTSFNTRSPLHFSDYNAMHKFWGDFVFTLVISIFWTLMFESPIVMLEKIIFGGAKRPLVELSNNARPVKELSDV